MPGNITTIVFTIEGGPDDGLEVETHTTSEQMFGHAATLHVMTNGGEVGRQFAGISLAAMQRSGQNPSQLPVYEYNVVSREVYDGTA